MLKIRDQHLASLGEQQTANFVGRMMVHLREVFTAEVARLDDRGLEELISRVCEQAQEWDITMEPSVERLVELFVSFDSLRRKPLPEWISNAVGRPGPKGLRLLLSLENGLLFAEGRTIPAPSFHARAYELFYAQITQEAGGTLPLRLQNAQGGARMITMSPADRSYRRQWRAIGAQMRRSQAIPTNSLKSPSTPWLTKIDPANFSPVSLPSARGSITISLPARRLR